MLKEYIKMLRYHKKVYFPESDKNKLENITKNLNILNWQYSRHTLDNLKFRSIDIEDILLFIKNITLEYHQIFEYYKYREGIEKICYRISYNDYDDIILVLNENKLIITIYLNSKNDKHETLKENLYCRH